MVDSKSTDKLELLLKAMVKIPEETLDRVSSVELTWRPINGSIVPFVSVTFLK